MIEFPQYPSSKLQDDELRQAYAKASALVTFGLEEIPVEHSRNKQAALVTDATHTLPQDKSGIDYLCLAQRELAVAEGLLDTDDSLRTSLREVRTNIDSVIQTHEN